MPMKNTDTIMRRLGADELILEEDAEKDNGYDPYNHAPKEVQNIRAISGVAKRQSRIVARAS